MRNRILLFTALLLCLFAMACGTSSSADDAAESESAAASSDENSGDAASAGSADAPEITGSMALSYAEQFTIDYCADGCTLITIGGADEYLIVPEDTAVPSYASEMTVIMQPLSDIYLASSAVMDLFVELGSLDAVSFTSTDQESWSIEEAAEAIGNGTLTYVGKYSAPDYETLLEAGCALAVENTMIYHQPEVKEQLENLGISVLVDLSSYESHPLGRTEWIRLYGTLLGLDEEADALFAEKEALFESVLSAVEADHGASDSAADADTGTDTAAEDAAADTGTDTAAEDDTLTVAYFYMTAAGAANIRKPGDYITKLIEYAGGTYVFTAADLDLDEEEDNALSTMNLQFEAFYAQAKDADVLIYNSSISGALYTMDDLIDLNSLFSDFAAVQAGHVWCTEKDMFQQTGAAADILEEFYEIFNGTAPEEMQFFHRLQGSE